jgi:rhamnosyl/mannosyltransferase
MSRRIRPTVLHVYKDFYPPVLGGIEKCIHWMCDATREVFDPRVLVAARATRTTDTVEDGIRVVRVGCWGRVLSAPIAPGFGAWLRRLDADILHFHMPNPTGELAWLASRRRLRGRLVVTYHSDIVRQRLTGLLYGPLQQRFLRGARVIMPTSEAYLHTSATLAPHHARCRVVPLGVPLAGLAESDGSRIFGAEIRRRAAGRVAVVFLGLLRYYKGLPFLIEAMRVLPESVCLFIGGDAPAGRAEERAELERQVAEAGLGDRVTFLGALNDAEAVGLRRAGDIFCLPSHLRGEAFGLTQIEAMACGLPVVSTDLPGVSEVNRAGETGLVAPPGDARALAEALGTLSRDETLRRQLGEAARRHAEEVYSAEAMGRRLIAVYEECLKSEG